MILSWKIPLFLSIFMSLALNSSTSAQITEGERERKLNQNFIIIDEKFKTIDQKMEQLESKGNDDYTRKFEKTDENFQKMEQFFNITEKLEVNFKKMEFFVSHLLKAFNACDPNPCLYGGRCRIATTGSGYQCDCSNFRSGSRCENFNCMEENRCFRLNDTVYVVIETRLTWAEAKVNCEGLNMTLAMPKDEDRTRFLWTQLKPIDKSVTFYLWIGLKRDEGGSGWLWVDGSALGEYVGGNNVMKSYSGSLFGVLHLPGGGSQMWGWSYSINNNYYHSICETPFH